MSYSLILDYREHKIKEYFDKYDFSKDKNLKKIEFKVENLDLGDILIKKDEKIVLIIERKTLQDLYSSINDGRYKEQKVRLKNNYSDSQIVYIIEDCNVKFVKNKFANFESIINGAIINSIFRDNIKLIRTKSVEDTIIYIKTLLKKVKNNIEFFENCSEISSDNDIINNQSNDDSNNIKIIELKSNNVSSKYVDNIKIKKKENNNPNNCNIIMLCQIPGVSTKISKTICDKYSCISNLVLEYNKLNTLKEKETLLKDYSYSINNDKTRKIGPVISKRIYEYLFTTNA
jgi:crossover junction endonuclease MUS81